MTNPTTDDFQEWLRLAEEAFSATDGSYVDVSINAWSSPVAWLAKSTARQR
jgi:hypothetical protein